MKFIFIILFVLYPSICFGVYEWKLIKKTKNSYYYIDMNTFTIQNERRFYLKLRSYKEKNQYEEKSNIVHFETDCDTLKSRFLKTIYPRNIEKGKSKLLNEVGNWKIFEKGSTGMYIANYVCSLSK